MLLACDDFKKEDRGRKGDDLFLVRTFDKGEDLFLLVRTFHKGEVTSFFLVTTYL